MPKAGIRSVDIVIKAVITSEPDSEKKHRPYRERAGKA